MGVKGLRKQEKEQKIAELKQMVASAAGLVLLLPTGVRAQQMASLRGKLRGGGCSMKVVRNTLFRRALRETWAEGIAGEVIGPLAVLACGEDLVAGAKSALGLEAGAPGLRVKAGFLASKVRTRGEVLEIANLPAREVLLGQLLFLLQSPVSRVIETLERPARNLVATLQAAAQRTLET